MEYQVINNLPCVNQFMKLRESVGWINPSSDVVKMSLANSVFITSVFSGSNSLELDESLVMVPCISICRTL